MRHLEGCNCGQCRLIRGEAISGHCAICKRPGMFAADDIVVVDGWELFAHFDCRRDRAAVHELERLLREAV